MHIHPTVTELIPTMLGVEAAGVNELKNFARFRVRTLRVGGSLVSSGKLFPSSFLLFPFFGIAQRDCDHAAVIQFFTGKTGTAMCL